MKRSLFAFFSILGMDVWSKYFALHSIPPFGGSIYPFGGIGVFDWGWITCSLNTIGNTGAAWGLFQGYSGLLFAFRVCVIGALLIYLYRQRVFSPLWLIAAGAVGNAIDYCAYGFVVDFFHFTFWGHTFPIFNVADSAITIGAALFLFTTRRYANLKPAN